MVIPSSYHVKRIKRFFVLPLSYPGRGATLTTWHVERSSRSSFFPPSSPSSMHSLPRWRERRDHPSSSRRCAITCGGRGDDGPAACPPPYPIVLRIQALWSLRHTCLTPKLHQIRGPPHRNPAKVTLPFRKNKEPQISRVDAPRATCAPSNTITYYACAQGRTQASASPPTPSSTPPRLPPSASP